ncbi:anhydro-N-acetylmuramic acid kinase [Marinoscillum pacificum]|uniref:anhydro-N-acetylmuramic acid kinase n=1 Tax=Marinoscillum pacificum TaxID=392723 RepID=UPI00215898D0|nr:anhydro-N-acetylmuramic acid kinase [Marinoscillum pacificum]
MSEYNVIGVMSGSSLDGLDVCVSEFRLSGQRWTYTITHCETVTIPEEIISQLRGADQLSAADLQELDNSYGEWIGYQLVEIIKTKELNVQLIGVHGHTVLHDPLVKKISLQIGNGAIIHQITGIEVVDNFRMKDISLGGQGAPLVPAGEHYLFSDHKAFLNLGGICNLSIHDNQKILAWDIAPCNQVLNHFAKQLGHSYDDGGQLSLKGHRDNNWLTYLGSLDYFHKTPPKSLANQWTSVVLKGAPQNPSDGLASYVYFLSKEISKSIRSGIEVESVMLTGGGAYNQVLVDQLNQELNGTVNLHIPSTDIIEYKEALIFGFLSLLRKLNIANVFASATGAQQDSVSGDLHSVV